MKILIIILAYLLLRVYASGQTIAPHQIGEVLTDFTVVIPDGYLSLKNGLLFISNFIFHEVSY